MSIQQELAAVKNAQEWKQVGEETYRNSNINHYQWPKELQPVDLSRMIVGWANNGGPLAVIAPGHGPVYIFLSDGLIYQTFVPSELIGNRGVIINMCFTCKEDLILVYNTGNICVVDIVNVSVKWESRVGHNEEICVAKFSCKRDKDEFCTEDRDVLCVYTTQANFYYKEIYCQEESQPTKFDKFIDFDILSRPGHEIRIIAINSDGFVYEVDEMKKFSNVNNAKKLAISPDGSRIAIFLTETTVIMRPSHDSQIQERIIHNFQATDDPRLFWCGNNFPVLVEGLSIFPLHKLTSAKRPHIFCLTETDGLRVLSDTGSHLLSRVSDKVRQTLEDENYDSNKLLRAFVGKEEKYDQAFQIISELKAERNLYKAVEMVIEAIKNENFDPNVIKHLMGVASFSKKFLTQNDEGFDEIKAISDKYSRTCQKKVALQFIRQSEKCPRAITYDQAMFLGLKDLLALQTKFRDYELAEEVIEMLLNQGQVESKNEVELKSVYEGWCQVAVEHSKKSQRDLQEAIDAKLDQLRGKLVRIQQNLTPKQCHHKQGEILKVDLDISFVILAKIAHKRQFKELKCHLIEQERQPQLRVQFYLFNKEVWDALREALKMGDPNQINQVFFSMSDAQLRKFKRIESLQGLRQLRSYAKEVDEELLIEVHKYNRTDHDHQVFRSGKTYAHLERANIFVELEKV